MGGVVMEQRECTGLTCDGPGFNSGWEWCRTEFHVLSKGQ